MHKKARRPLPPAPPVAVSQITTPQPLPQPAAKKRKAGPLRIASRASASNKVRRVSALPLQQVGASRGPPRSSASPPPPPPFRVLDLSGRVHLFIPHIVLGTPHISSAVITHATLSLPYPSFRASLTSGGTISLIASEAHRFASPSLLLRFPYPSYSSEFAAFVVQDTVRVPQFLFPPLPVLPPIVATGELYPGLFIHVFAHLPLLNQAPLAWTWLSPLKPPRLLALPASPSSLFLLLYPDNTTRLVPLCPSSRNLTWRALQGSPLGARPPGFRENAPPSSALLSPPLWPVPPPPFRSPPLP